MTPAILIVEGLLIVLGFKGFEIVLIGATSLILKSFKSNKTLVRRAFDNTIFLNGFPSHPVHLSKSALHPKIVRPLPSTNSLRLSE